MNRLLGAGVLVVLGGLGGGLLSSRPAQGGSMTGEEVKAAMHRLATKTWGLQQVACPEPFDLGSGTLCYAVREDADVFRRRVDAVGQKTLRNVTGWRDDYTLNAAFQYQQAMYELGLSYVYSNSFWDQPRYAELRALGVHAYVAIGVSDEKPRDR